MIASKTLAEMPGRLASHGQIMKLGEQPIEQGLYGRILSLQAFYVAYKQVKKSRGAAGIDG